MASESPRVSVVGGFAAVPADHTYFIAEAGNNHNGSLDMAKQLVDVAVECGADAVKFQKRDISSMLTSDHLDRHFFVQGAEEWGDTYRKVREHIELDTDQLRTLKEYCHGKIDFLVTPFDLPSVEVLEEIGVDAYKIAAFTVTDIPVLEAVARTGKTIFLSAGMVTDDELIRAIDVLDGCDLVLLHCISCYPMKPHDANLHLIQWLKRFGYPVGWSDHEVGITLSPVAVTLGARVVERHYTLDRALPGFDHAMSLEPTGLRKVIRDIRKVEEALTGLRDHREVLPCELKAFDQKRRTVCSTRAIKRGEIFQAGHADDQGPQPGAVPEVHSRDRGQGGARGHPRRHPHHVLDGAAVISVIIRTRNEAEWIGRCLSAVMRQEGVDFEVIVVDNESTDDTVAIVRQHEAKLVTIGQTDFTYGKALNDGVRASTGDLICCVSGHCIPENTNWLFWLRTPFVDERVAGVYGRQLPVQATHVLDKRDMWNLFGPERKVQTSDPFFHNANSMLRRSVWEDIPFDEQANGVEDRIWAQKVLARQYTIVYEPNGAVYHPHGVNQTADIHRAERVVRAIEQNRLHVR